MIKEELLKQINALPNGIEVCIFDFKRNEKEDSGDETGCSAGIYKEYQISIMGAKDIPDGTKPFAVISFDNPYVDEEN